MAKKQKEVPEVEVKETPTPKSKIKLISYTVRAIIPTGPYANIQPEITIEAPSLEEAKTFIYPHIDQLFGRYLHLEERVEAMKRKEAEKPQPTAPVTLEPVASTPEPAPVTPVVSTPAEPQQLNMNDLVGALKAPDNASIFMIKAVSAIESCQNPEALEMIKNQVINSVKLTAEEKLQLSQMLEAKSKILNG